VDTVHECDRQTDRQTTDGQTDRITITDTVQRIASHGKNQQFITSHIELSYSYIVSQKAVQNFFQNFQIPIVKI